MIFWDLPKCNYFLQSEDKLYKWTNLLWKIGSCSVFIFLFFFHNFTFKEFSFCHHKIFVWGNIAFKDPSQIFLGKTLLLLISFEHESLQLNKKKTRLNVIKHSKNKCMGKHVKFLVKILMLWKKLTECKGVSYINKTTSFNYTY